MLRKIVLGVLVLGLTNVFAENFYFGKLLPQHSQQLVVVEGSQDSIHAQLSAYTKVANGKWLRSLGPFKVIVGRKGIARLGSKEDGDAKTPAGLYSIGSIYGYFPNEKVKYLYWEIDKGQQWLLAAESNAGGGRSPELTYARNAENSESLINGLELIGSNPSSRSLMPESVVKLNFVHTTEKAKVNRRAVSKFGIVINYNLGPINRNKQALFLYSWKDPRYGSEGSIALSKLDLYQLILWLNIDKTPYIFIDYTIPTRTN